MSLAPGSEDAIIKIYGLNTVRPTDIMKDNRQAIPLLDALYNGDVSNTLGCGPFSPKLDDPGYVPAANLGYCTSTLQSAVLRQHSKCHLPENQIDGGESKCTKTLDSLNKNQPCIWVPFAGSPSYTQVENNGMYPHANKWILESKKSYYNEPNWTTVLNGNTCDYPPYTQLSSCHGSGPTPPPAACSPSRIKCSAGSDNPMSTYDFAKKLAKSPGFKMSNPCWTPNPVVGGPAKWSDSTCSIFHDLATRAFTSVDSAEPGQNVFPVQSDLYKPTLFNNVPFNYNSGKGKTSYCYVPGPTACPKIGDVPGQVRGVAKIDQLQSWLNTDYNEYNNIQNVLCEYSVPAKHIVYEGPGGFIKNSQDFQTYVDQKTGSDKDQFFKNYQGFPTNDSMYQYIMLDRCLQPVDNDEIKDCIGIDKNTGPIHIPHGLKKNPQGMKPETYWNDAYRLDPMLESKLSPSSSECVNNPCLRAMSEKCYGSPCPSCLNNPNIQDTIKDSCAPSGPASFSPALRKHYCEHCRGPLKYAHDTPRCSRMNKSTPDGHACRKWYKETAAMINQAVIREGDPKKNPEYNRAILYNSCLRTAPNPSKCTAKKSDGTNLVGPEPWKPYPPKMIETQLPIYFPGPGGKPDWDATRKKLHIGASPKSASTLFNKKAKEFCSAPGSQYLWECGCINASTDSPASRNHYANLYRSMKFAPSGPGPSSYKEGYLSATGDQEQAKYCWLQPCKFPFGEGGMSTINLDDPVRFADLTLSGESQFQNKEMSICPEYNCESIVVTTTGSYIDKTTMQSVMQATTSGKPCQSVKNSFWIEDPVVCAFGPSSSPGALNGPDPSAPGSTRDPGNWCYDSTKFYPKGSPSRVVRQSDQNAFMLEEMCFNSCHNWNPIERKPQKTQPYMFPTFDCTNSGCVEILPPSPQNEKYSNSPGVAEKTGLGEFFEIRDCKRECMTRNTDKKRGVYYIILIIISILAGIFIFLALRKYFKHQSSVIKYEQYKKTRINKS